jgi:hypothetical protein
MGSRSVAFSSGMQLEGVPTRHLPASTTKEAGRQGRMGLSKMMYAVSAEHHAEGKTHVISAERSMRVRRCGCKDHLVAELYEAYQHQFDARNKETYVVFPRPAFCTVSA